MARLGGEIDVEILERFDQSAYTHNGQNDPQASKKRRRERFERSFAQLNRGLGKAAAPLDDARGNGDDDSSYDSDDVGESCSQFYLLSSIFYLLSSLLSSIFCHCPCLDSRFSAQANILMNDLTNRDYPFFLVSADAPMYRGLVASDVHVTYRNIKDLFARCGLKQATVMMTILYAMALTKRVYASFALLMRDALAIYAAEEARRAGTGLHMELGRAKDLARYGSMLQSTLHQEFIQGRHRRLRSALKNAEYELQLKARQLHVDGDQRKWVVGALGLMHVELPHAQQRGKNGANRATGGGGGASGGGGGGDGDGGDGFVDGVTGGQLVHAQKDAHAKWLSEKETAAVADTEAAERNAVLAAQLAAAEVAARRRGKGAPVVE
jgi:hypothetical protein